MSQFYYSPDGTEVSGPISEQELSRLHVAGKLASETVVCQEGTEVWLPIADVLSPMSAFESVNSPAEAQANSSRRPSKGFFRAMVILGGVTIALIGGFLITKVKIPQDNPETAQDLLTNEVKPTADEQRSGDTPKSFAEPSPAPTPAPVSLDLIDAKFRDTDIFDLTLDQVTDILGRPATVISPAVARSGSSNPQGAYLTYPGLGLSFLFSHPEVDSEQHCKTFIVRFSSGTDDVTKEHVEPYHGTVSFGISSQWKTPKLMETLAQFDPRDMYDAEQAKALRGMSALLEDINQATEEMGGRRSGDITITKHELGTFVVVTLPTHKLSFEYEENTKFVEAVQIARQEEDE
ncbi:MAG: DUF4339 domain-containing protein [Chthoniobacterales bacterium]|nr:DUF4339 domain-containing protein [Chthoniobacterales bacterium]